MNVPIIFELNISSPGPNGVEVWKCSNCGRLHKRIKGTDECEPLVSEHKTEFVPPDRETIQDATGKKTSGVYVK